MIRQQRVNDVFLRDVFLKSPVTSNFANVNPE